MLAPSKSYRESDPGYHSPDLASVNGERHPGLDRPRGGGRVWRVLIGATHHFNLRVSDWLMAMILTTFGGLLLANPAVFDPAHSFAVLSQMAPAQSWGLSCLAIGLTRLFALIVNGTFPAFRWSPHIRFTMAMLSCFVWFQLTLGIALVPIATAALAVYPYLCLFDLYNTFLAASEAGVVERRCRNGGG